METKWRPNGNLMETNKALSITTNYSLCICPAMNSDNYDHTYIYVYIFFLIWITSNNFTNIFFLVGAKRKKEKEKEKEKFKEEFKEEFKEKK